MQLPQLENYQQLFLNNIPLLDVRAPVEYKQGAFPHTQNLPLLSNDERHQIGVRYQEKGQDEAIQLGQALIKGEIKNSRVADWVRFTEQHPQGALYCFRGGLRSQICQQWIYEPTGVIYPRIKGGYKALRRFLITELDLAAQQQQFIIVGGRTGSGKTRFLQQLQHHIDLEGIFHHRGSAFGKRATPQPSQIDIENRLAIDLLKQRHSQANKLVLEDEAANIGSRQVPLSIHKTMQRSPIIILEVNTDERIENVLSEYVHDTLREYQELHGQSVGLETWVQNLRLANERIQKRLGGQRHKEMSAILNDAIYQHTHKGETEHYKNWISELLAKYYDPMYDYQLSNKTERVIAHGGHASMLEYLQQQHGMQ